MKQATVLPFITCLFFDNTHSIQPIKLFSVQASPMQNAVHTQINSPLMLICQQPILCPTLLLYSLSPHSDRRRSCGSGIFVEMLRLCCRLDCSPSVRCHTHTHTHSYQCSWKRGTVVISDNQDHKKVVAGLQGVLPNELCLRQSTELFGW